MSKSQRAKWALITGANGGIGQGLVHGFINAGYHILATDIHVSSIAPPHDNVVYVPADLEQYVRDESFAQTLNQTVMNILPNNKLNVLVNNAAIQLLGSVEDLDRACWQKNLDINLSAPFHLSQGMLPLLENCSGSIINISSIHASLTKKGFIAYATSKAALSGMTRAMATDLQDRVRVNAIEPAAIETKMLHDGFTQAPEKLNLLKKHHPVQSIGHPDDITQAALFLADPENSFLQGAILNVSGGIHNCLHDPA